MQLFWEILGVAGRVAVPLVAVVLVDETLAGARQIGSAGRAQQPHLVETCARLCFAEFEAAYRDLGFDSAAAVAENLCKSYLNRQSTARSRRARPRRRVPWYRDTRRGGHAHTAGAHAMGGGPAGRASSTRAWRGFNAHARALGGHQDHRGR